MLREYCTLELCVELIMRNYLGSSKLVLICIMQIIVMAAQHQAPGPCLFVFNFSSNALFMFRTLLGNFVKFVSFKVAKETFASLSTCSVKVYSNFISSGLG